MRRFLGRFLFIVILIGGIASSFGAEYKLLNGDVVKGEAASFTDDGLIVRLEVGGFSPRIGWGKLTQESLKAIAENPQAKKFVEPFIEVPIEVKRKKLEKKPIIIKEPPVVQNPTTRPKLFSSLNAAPGLLILGLLYLANLYAAYHIALYKNRPIVVVVGLSALAPVLGPILFAILPGSGVAAPEVDHSAPAEQASSASPAPAPAAAAAGGLGLAAAAAGNPKASSNPAYNQLYNRTNTTFDRRFFETKFSGFFRTIPSDAEKDMVLVVKTQKNQYVGKRISRISMTEMHMQLQQGASEAAVPFADIVEVAVRHKDAK